MVAALADHAGGEASLRGMVISLGGEVAAPGECDAVKPERGRDRAVGAIADLHHCVAPSAPAARSDREA